MSQTTETSKDAYRKWLETELLPNSIPPSYEEWMDLMLTEQHIAHLESMGLRVKYVEDDAC